MNAPASWEALNNAYLSEALQWLRGRLKTAADSVSLPETDDPKRTADEAGDARPTYSVVGDDPARRRVKATEATLTPPSALTSLSQRLGLSSFEADILLLCAAMELDTRIPSLCAAASSDPNRRFPTFGLALSLFDDPTWDALSPYGPLRYWRLIEIHQAPAQPLIATALRADERIVGYLKGLNYIDDRIENWVTPFWETQVDDVLAPTQRARVEEICSGLNHAAHEGSVPVFQLVCSDPATRRLIAGSVASRVGLRLHQLDIGSLQRLGPELETFSRLWARESRLMPIALYMDCDDLDTSSATELSLVRRLLAKLDGLAFIGVRESLPRLHHYGVVQHVSKPTPFEQRELWHQALQLEDPTEAQSLSSQYNLDASTIKRIAKTVQTLHADHPQLASALWAASREAVRPSVLTLADLLEPKAGWDDLILPDEQMNLLTELSNQVRHRTVVYEDWGFRERMSRGFGIAALFAGESGTGKTMAAEVIAKAIDLDLYRIDLASVVSKYVGETEKNLRRLFDAFEDGGAVLFFDEADALFGKRSEVKDSHDRYANIEINYLLQRIEAYRGLVILATNRKSALDEAFLRRLRFIVEFPYPGIAERLRIWQRAFPPKTPVETLDYERLAKLSLAGGNIHSVALNAAFRAAHARKKVTMDIVLDAARTEFFKLGLSMSDAEFR